LKKRKSPERDIHRAVVQHLTKRAKPGVVWFHVPNAPRNAVAGAMLKKLGMRAGVSDLILFHNGELFALELKAPKGRESIEQMEFQSEIRLAGGFTSVSTGLDEALNVLNLWGLLR
jgi:hypothetical protein